MSVGDEFGRRVSDDELCAEVRQAVEDGDEDALRRLGFGGFGGYVQRLSEIMSDSVTDGLDPSADDFGAIMGEVASPARYAHHLVNEAGTAIQSAKDKPLGIRIKPAEPDFDDDALCGTVGKAASMDTPEQTAASLAEGLSYAVKKAGNDFIKANAEQRSRAGFEVKVKRSGSTKCCPWCAARIGSWAIANAPDGVFGCHANCSCVVEYTSSTGAKTSASGANLHRYGAGAFAEIEYQPHVMSHEEAREKGGFDEPKRLTGGANGGIIGLGAKIGGTDYVELHEEPKFIKKIDPKDPSAIQKEIESFEKWAVNSDIENACVITKNGEVFYCYGTKRYVYPDVDLGEKIRGAIISHNHVRSETNYSFSGLDLSLFSNYELELLRGIDYRYLYEFSKNPSEIDEAPEDEFGKENEQHTFMIMRAEQYGIGYRRWEHD